MADRPGPLLELDHPAVLDRLARLRDRRTDNAMFRQLIAEVSSFVAYEALRDLGTEIATIDTPVTSGVPVVEVAETVLLVPVLRAGLGMVQAIQELLPLTAVAHVGLRRNEETLVSEVYLNKLPADLSGRRVAILEPMVATGGSLAQVCDLVVERGGRRVVVLSIIATATGIARFHERHPEVRVVCAAVDPGLDAHGFVVPGLGDAGDRLFGPPA